MHYVEIYPGQALSAEKKNVKVGHDMSQEDLDAMLAKAKECGVKITSYGVVMVSMDENASRKVFDFGKKVGLETIVSEPPLDSWDTLDKLAQEYRLNVAAHEHSKQSKSLYWDPQTVVDVTKGKSKMVGACADTGHWQRSGLDPVASLKLLEGRVIELHVKDLNKFGEQNGTDVPWGTGVGKVKECLAELKRQGAKPVFYAEYETGHGTELVRNVARSLDYFSQVATELAGDARAAK